MIPPFYTNILDQGDHRQMGGIEGVEEPAVHLHPAVGAAEDQGQGQQGEDGPVDAQAAHGEAQGVLRPAVQQGGEVAEGVEPRADAGVVPAEVEDQHELDAGAGVVEVPPADGEEGQGEEPPLPLLQPDHGQQAQEQGEEDVPVGEVGRELTHRVEGQDVEGLAHQGEDAQAQEVLLHVPGVEQAHGEAVAEDGEGQAADPAEDPHLREEGPADVVDEHGDDGDELQKVRVQVGFQPVPLRRDDRRGGEGAADALAQGAGFSGCGVGEMVHGELPPCLVAPSIARKKRRRKRPCHLRRLCCQVWRRTGRGCHFWTVSCQVWFGRRAILWYNEGQ